MGTSQKEILKERGICVVIPTYNNAGTIGQVVTDVLEYCDDVIVVNDGCTDDTQQILSKIEGITIVENDRNKGKGKALKEGFRKALDMGFAYAITIDADGQHYAKDINRFLEANQANPGALIVGERNLEGVDRSAGSDFANKFANFWFAVQTGRRLKDTQTGYRLYPLKKLWGLSLLTSRYEAELELLVFASWHGVKIVSMPIDVYYPPRAERISHFRPGADFMRITVLNTVLCGLAIVYGLPMRLIRLAIRVVRNVYSLLFFVIFSLFVVTPLVWAYLKLTKRTENRNRKIHKLIYRLSRIIMIYHGIPGVKYGYKLNDKKVFDKPAVIISNHQSHLDLVSMLTLTPKVIFLTNDWVWHNPFYGVLIRNAEYYNVSEGLDVLMPKFQSLIERGYSIAVFPEGTRSEDCKIRRFHKGAFHIAEQLGLDILPICLYGPGKVLPKKDHSMKSGRIFVEVGERIGQDEMKKIGDTKQQASYMRKFFVEKYSALCNKIEQDV